MLTVNLTLTLKSGAALTLLAGGVRRPRPASLPCRSPLQGGMVRHAGDTSSRAGARPLSTTRQTEAGSCVGARWPTRLCTTNTKQTQQQRYSVVQTSTCVSNGGGTNEQTTAWQAVERGRSRVPWAEPWMVASLLQSRGPLVGADTVLLEWEICMEEGKGGKKNEGTHDRQRTSERCLLVYTALCVHGKGGRKNMIISERLNDA